MLEEIITEDFPTPPADAITLQNLTDSTSGVNQPQRQLPVQWYVEQQSSSVPQIGELRTSPENLTFDMPFENDAWMTDCTTLNMQSENSGLLLYPGIFGIDSQQYT